MKNFIFNNQIVSLWKDANSHLEYLFVFLITILSFLTISGLIVFIFHLIINPQLSNNIQFGLIDFV